MGSAMVRLDWALVSSYRLSIVTVLLSVTIWSQFAVQILTDGSDPQFNLPNLPFPWGDWGPCLIQCHLGTQRMALPNGISFHPTAFAGCTNVIDIQTD